jgi:hypothetical protein
VTVNLAVGPVVALLAGILILVVPRLLNFIVAIYLIIIGLVGIFGLGGTHIHSTATDIAPAPSAPVITAVAAPAGSAFDPHAIIGRERGGV